MESNFIYILVVIMLFASFVQGSIGFGFPMVSTAFLALFTDIQTAIYFTLIPSIFLNIISIKSEGNFFKALKEFYIFGLFSMFGCTLGTYLLINFEVPAFKILLAVVILFYLFFNQFNLKILFILKYPKLAEKIFGMLTGFIGGLTNVMAPVFLIYSIESKYTRAQTIQAGNICFLLTKVIQLLMFVFIGNLSNIEFEFSIYILLGVVCSFYLGIQIKKRVDTIVYKKIIKVLLFLIALNIIFQELF